MQVHVLCLMVLLKSKPIVANVEKFSATPLNSNAPVSAVSVEVRWSTLNSKMLCMEARSGKPWSAEIPYRGWAGHLDAIWNGGCPAPQSVSDPDFDPVKWYGTLEKPSRGTNGNPQEHAPGMNCGNFTCLVGISLSDQETEGMGNVGVLRVSHTQQLGCALPRALCKCQQVSL